MRRQQSSFSGAREAADRLVGVVEDVELTNHGALLLGRRDNNTTPEVVTEL